MILINEILKDMETIIPYEIIAEEPIETFGLVGYFCNGKSQCTFVDDINYVNSIKKNTRMIITTKEIARHVKNQGVCITEFPRMLFFSIHNYLKDSPKYCREINQKIIGKKCRISELAYIAEENIVIGDNVIIEEFVSIKKNTVIGNNVIIRAGSIIGSEGFEFKRYNDSIISVAHLGGVIIGDNVEIQSNSCVDKAVYPWDDTIILDNSKIDKLVYIAHGVKIEKNVLVVAQSGILGRSVIGNNSKIGLGAGLRNAITIGSNCDVSMGAIVTQDIDKGSKVSGNFAIEHDKYIEFIKSIR